MTSSILLVVAIGGIATTMSALAARDSGRPGGRRRFAALAFWVIVTAYMSMFTALRLAHILYPDLETFLFYAQTVSGAATVIALSHIMVGVAFGHKWSRLGAEIAAALAVSILTLIFAFGLIGPRHDAWTVEYIPFHEPTRWAIGAVYVLAPTAMSLLAVLATWTSKDKSLRTQSLMFSSAVVLIFGPNAIKYVFFVDGPVAVALAIIMAGGTWIGWRSYHVR